jgi:hypothetical protein
MTIKRILCTLNYIKKVLKEFMIVESFKEHKDKCELCYVIDILNININKSIKYIKSNNISDNDIIIFTYLKRIKKIFEVIFNLYRDSPNMKNIFNKLDEVIQLEPMDDINNPCFMFEEKCQFDLDLGDIDSCESSEIDIKSLLDFDNIDVDEYDRLESFKLSPILFNEEDNSNEYFF